MGNLLALLSGSADCLERFVAMIINAMGHFVGVFFEATDILQFLTDETAKRNAEAHLHRQLLIRKRSYRKDLQTYQQDISRCQCAVCICRAQCREDEVNEYWNVLTEYVTKLSKDNTFQSQVHTFVEIIRNFYVLFQYELPLCCGEKDMMELAHQNVVQHLIRPLRVLIKEGKYSSQEATYDVTYTPGQPRPIVESARAPLIRLEYEDEKARFIGEIVNEQEALEGPFVDLRSLIGYPDPTPPGEGSIIAPSVGRRSVEKVRVELFKGSNGSRKSDKPVLPSTSQPARKSPSPPSLSHVIVPPAYEVNQGRIRVTSRSVERRPSTDSGTKSPEKVIHGSLVRSPAQTELAPRSSSDYNSKSHSLKEQVCAPPTMLQDLKKPVQTSPRTSPTQDKIIDNTLDAIPWAAYDTLPPEREEIPARAHRLDTEKWLYASLIDNIRTAQQAVKQSSQETQLVEGTGRFHIDDPISEEQSNLESSSKDEPTSLEVLDITMPVKPFQEKSDTSQRFSGSTKRFGYQHSAVTEVSIPTELTLTSVQKKLTKERSVEREMPIQFGPPLQLLATKKEYKPDSPTQPPSRSEATDFDKSHEKRKEHMEEVLVVMSEDLERKREEFLEIEKKLEVYRQALKLSEQLQKRSDQVQMVPKETKKDDQIEHKQQVQHPRVANKLQMQSCVVTSSFDSKHPGDSKEQEAEPAHKAVSDRDELVNIIENVVKEKIQVFARTNLPRTDELQLQERRQRRLTTNTVSRTSYKTDTGIKVKATKLNKLELTTQVTGAITGLMCGLSDQLAKTETEGTTTTEQISTMHILNDTCLKLVKHASRSTPKASSVQKSKITHISSQTEIVMSPRTLLESSSNTSVTYQMARSPTQHREPVVYIKNHKAKISSNTTYVTATDTSKPHRPTVESIPKRESEITYRSTVDEVGPDMTLDESMFAQISPSMVASLNNPRVLRLRPRQGNIQKIAMGNVHQGVLVFKYDYTTDQSVFDQFEPPQQSTDEKNAPQSSGTTTLTQKDDMTIPTASTMQSSTGTIKKIIKREGESSMQSRTGTIKKIIKREGESSMQSSTGTTKKIMKREGESRKKSMVTVQEPQEVMFPLHQHHKRDHHGSSNIEMDDEMERNLRLFAEKAGINPSVALQALIKAKDQSVQEAPVQKEPIQKKKAPPKKVLPIKKGPVHAQKTILKEDIDILTPVREESVLKLDDKLQEAVRPTPQQPPPQQPTGNVSSDISKNMPSSTLEDIIAQMKPRVIEVSTPQQEAPKCIPSFLLSQSGMQKPAQPPSIAQLPSIAQPMAQNLILPPRNTPTTPCPDVTKTLEEPQQHISLDSPLDAAFQLLAGCIPSGLQPPSLPQNKIFQQQPPQQQLTVPQQKQQPCQQYQQPLIYPQLPQQPTYQQQQNPKNIGLIYQNLIKQLSQTSLLELHGVLGQSLTAGQVDNYQNGHKKKHHKHKEKDISTSSQASGDQLVPATPKMSSKSYANKSGSSTSPRSNIPSSSSTESHVPRQVKGNIKKIYVEPINLQQSIPEKPDSFTEESSVTEIVSQYSGLDEGDKYEESLEEIDDSRFTKQQLEGIPLYNKIPLHPPGYSTQSSQHDQKKQTKQKHRTTCKDYKSPTRRDKDDDDNQKSPRRRNEPKLTQVVHSYIESGKPSTQESQTHRRTNQYHRKKKEEVVTSEFNLQGTENMVTQLQQGVPVIYQRRAVEADIHYGPEYMRQLEQEERDKKEYQKYIKMIALSCAKNCGINITDEEFREQYTALTGNVYRSTDSSISESNVTVSITRRNYSNSIIVEATNIRDNKKKSVQIQVTPRPGQAFTFYGTQHAGLKAVNDLQDVPQYLVPLSHEGRQVLYAPQPLPENSNLGIAIPILTPIGIVYNPLPNIKSGQQIQQNIKKSINIPAISYNLQEQPIVAPRAIEDTPRAEYVNPCLAGEQSPHNTISTNTFPGTIESFSPPLIWQPKPTVEIYDLDDVSTEENNVPKDILWPPKQVKQKTVLPTVVCEPNRPTCNFRANIVPNQPQKVDDKRARELELIKALGEVQADIHVQPQLINKNDQPSFMKPGLKGGAPQPPPVRSRSEGATDSRGSRTASPHSAVTEQSQIEGTDTIPIQSIQEQSETVSQIPADQCEEDQKDHQKTIGKRSQSSQSLKRRRDRSPSLQKGLSTTSTTKFITIPHELEDEHETQSVHHSRPRERRGAPDAVDELKKEMGEVMNRLKVIEAEEARRRGERIQDDWLPRPSTSSTVMNYDASHEDSHRLWSHRRSFSEVRDPHEVEMLTEKALLLRRIRHINMNLKMGRSQELSGPMISEVAGDVPNYLLSEEANLEKEWEEFHRKYQRYPLKQREQDFLKPKRSSSVQPTASAAEPVKDSTPGRFELTPEIFKQEWEKFIKQKLSEKDTPKTSLAASEQELPITNENWDKVCDYIQTQLKSMMETQVAQIMENQAEKVIRAMVPPVRAVVGGEPMQLPSTADVTSIGDWEEGSNQHPVAQGNWEHHRTRKDDYVGTRPGYAASGDATSTSDVEHFDDEQESFRIQSAIPKRGVQYKQRQGSKPSQMMLPITPPSKTSKVELGYAQGQRYDEPSDVDTIYYGDSTAQYVGEGAHLPSAASAERLGTASDTTQIPHAIPERPNVKKSQKPPMSDKSDEDSDSLAAKSKQKVKEPQQKQEPEMHKSRSDAQTETSMRERYPRRISFERIKRDTFPQATASRQRDDDRRKAEMKSRHPRAQYQEEGFISPAETEESQATVETPRKPRREGVMIKHHSRRLSTEFYKREPSASPTEITDSDVTTEVSQAPQKLKRDVRRYRQEEFVAPTGIVDSERPRQLKRDVEASEYFPRRSNIQHQQGALSIASIESELSEMTIESPKTPRKSKRDVEPAQYYSKQLSAHYLREGSPSPSEIIDSEIAIEVQKTPRKPKGNVESIGYYSRRPSSQYHQLETSQSLSAGIVQRPKTPRKSKQEVQVTERHSRQRDTEYHKQKVSMSPPKGVSAEDIKRGLKSPRTPKLPVDTAPIKLKIETPKSPPQTRQDARSSGHYSGRTTAQYYKQGAPPSPPESISTVAIRKESKSPRTPRQEMQPTTSYTKRSSTQYYAREASSSPHESIGESPRTPRREVLAIDPYPRRSSAQYYQREVSLSPECVDAEVRKGASKSPRKLKPEEHAPDPYTMRGSRQYYTREPSLSPSETIDTEITEALQLPQKSKQEVKAYRRGSSAQYYEREVSPSDTAMRTPESYRRRSDTQYYPREVSPTDSTDVEGAKSPRKPKQGLHVAEEYARRSSSRYYQRERSLSPTDTEATVTRPKMPVKSRREVEATERHVRRLSFHQLQKSYSSIPSETGPMESKKEIEKRLSYQYGTAMTPQSVVNEEKQTVRKPQSSQYVSTKEKMKSAKARIYSAPPQSGRYKPIPYQSNEPESVVFGQPDVDSSKLTSPCYSIPSTIDADLISSVSLYPPDYDAKYQYSQEPVELWDEKTKSWKPIPRGQIRTRERHKIPAVASTSKTPPEVWREMQQVSPRVKKTTAVKSQTEMTNVEKPMPKRKEHMLPMADPESPAFSKVQYEQPSQPQQKALQAEMQKQIEIESSAPRYRIQDYPQVTGPLIQGSVRVEPPIEAELEKDPRLTHAYMYHGASPNISLAKMKKKDPELEKYYLDKIDALPTEIAKTSRMILQLNPEISASDVYKFTVARDFTNSVDLLKYITEALPPGINLGTLRLTHSMLVSSPKKLEREEEVEEAVCKEQLKQQQTFHQKVVEKLETTEKPSSSHKPDQSHQRYVEQLVPPNQAPLHYVSEDPNQDVILWHKKKKRAPKDDPFKKL